MTTAHTATPDHSIIQIGDGHNYRVFLNGRVQVERYGAGCKKGWAVVPANQKKRIAAVLAKAGAA